MTYHNKIFVFQVLDAAVHTIQIEIKAKGQNNEIKHDVIKVGALLQCFCDCIRHVTPLLYSPYSLYLL